MRKKRENPLGDDNIRAVIAMIWLCTYDGESLISPHNVQKKLKFISPRVLNNEILPRLVNKGTIEEVKMFRQARSAYRISDLEEAEKEVMMMNEDDNKKGRKLLLELMNYVKPKDTLLNIVLIGKRSRR